MKMKKENMDHIRERFEKETGVTLPEKEGFMLPSWSGHLIAVAAGLICIVGLGLVWAKISAGKQDQSDMLMSSEDDTTGMQQEEETDVTEQETSGGESQTISEEEVRKKVEEAEAQTEEEKAALEEQLNYSLSDDNSDTDSPVIIISDSFGETVFRAGIFGDDADCTWPLPATIERAVGLSESDEYTRSFFTLSKDKTYMSIPGIIGDKVVAMHACVVTETGFDIDRGNYVMTKVNDNHIEYRHLDEINVSVGAALNAGDCIGTLGNSGRSTGPHLGIVATGADGTLMRLSNSTAYSESSD